MAVKAATFIWMALNYLANNNIVLKKVFGNSQIIPKTVKKLEILKINALILFRNFRTFLHSLKFKIYV